MAYTKAFYLPSGFLDYDWFMRRNRPVTMIVGGRAIGKTYGALKWHRDHGDIIAYVRRGDDELQSVGSQATCPYKSIAENDGFEFRVFGNNKIREVWEGVTEEDGSFTQTRLLAYECALVNFSKARGGDLTDVNTIIFDEFIPQLENRTVIRNEADALANLYDTFNRNKGTEYDPRPADRMIYLSNANTLQSTHFFRYGLDERIAEMQINKVDIYESADGMLGVYLPHDSPVAQARFAQVPFFALQKNSAYWDMAKDNVFTDRDRLLTRMRVNQLEKYKTVGKLTIYKVKGKSLFHVKADCTENPDYPAEKKGFAEFNRDFGEQLRMLYLMGFVTYDSGRTCEIMHEYFNFKYLFK